MNKKIIALLVILIVSGCVSSDLTTPEESVERKLLIVGESWPPFEYEEDGVVKGIHVEIVDLVMERLGVPYEIQFMPWSRALVMVETGEADVLLSASYTDERDEWAYFTEGQRLAGNEALPEAYLDSLDMVFFIREINKDAFVFESFEQIAEEGYRIGLNANYAYTDTVLEANWTTEYYYTTLDNFLALNEGTSDMYLQDKFVGLQVIKDMGLEDEITYIDKPVMTFVYHLPFSKNSDYPNLKEKWEQSIQELEEIQNSGVVDEIYGEYIQ